MEIKEIYQLCERIKRNIQRVVVGKDDTINALLITLIAGGHILLEDVPGTGKTLLAKSLAASIQGDYKRIQFTPDLLPSDISGINMYNQKSGEFEFIQGPIFSNLILADEVNRATPRTQSSLLECMEEKQVTIDGVTRKLKLPFMVIATQNPIETQGTFPLPEAQLDRFLIKTNMEYPTTSEMDDILKRFNQSNPLESLEPVATQEEILQAQNNYTRVFVSDAIYTYISSLYEATRKHMDVLLGVSPRGAQALLKASQVAAILDNKTFVTPQHVKGVASLVLNHRILASNHMPTTTKEIVADVLNKVIVPSESEFIQKVNA